MAIDIISHKAKIKKNHMVHSASNNEQLLFKILVAAAWIDGNFQTEEQAYLQKLAGEKNLSQDSEIKTLLSAQEPIDSQQCYQWLEEYLGNRPTSETYQNLLAEIAGLVYVDGDIAEEEAQLLTQLQNFDPNTSHTTSIFRPILKAIRKLYRRSIVT